MAGAKDTPSFFYDMDESDDNDPYKNAEVATTFESNEEIVKSRLRRLYPHVDHETVRFPRFWMRSDKHSHLKLSHMNLRVSYPPITGDTPPPIPVDGNQTNGKRSASIRANACAPHYCGIYYFEVHLIEGDGCMGIGLCSRTIDTSRLPGTSWDRYSYGYHGDDGNYFTASGNGVKYGPKFGAGDVVGCGLNLIKRTVFFTKNGMNLGLVPTSYISDPVDDLYPTVGLQSRSVIDVNFGQKQFQYDIFRDMVSLKESMKQEVTRWTLPPSASNKINLCIASWMSTMGLSKSLSVFKKDAQLTDPVAEDKHMKERRELMRLILHRRSSDAFRKIEENYAELFAKFPLVELDLRAQKFVEMCIAVSENRERPPKQSSRCLMLSVTSAGGPSVAYAPLVPGVNRRYVYGVGTPGQEEKNHERQLIKQLTLKKHSNKQLYAKLMAGMIVEEDEVVRRSLRMSLKGKEKKGAGKAKPREKNAMDTEEAGSSSARVPDSRKPKAQEDAAIGTRSARINAAERKKRLAELCSMVKGDLSTASPSSSGKEAKKGGSSVIKGAMDAATPRTNSARSKKDSTEGEEEKGTAKTTPASSRPASGKKESPRGNKKSGDTGKPAKHLEAGVRISSGSLASSEKPDMMAELYKLVKAGAFRKPSENTAATAASAESLDSQREAMMQMRKLAHYLRDLLDMEREKGKDGEEAPLDSLTEEQKKRIGLYLRNMMELKAREERDKKEKEGNRADRPPAKQPKKEEPEPEPEKEDKRGNKRERKGKKAETEASSSLPTEPKNEEEARDPHQARTNGNSVPAAHAVADNDKQKKETAKKNGVEGTRGRRGTRGRDDDSATQIVKESNNKRLMEALVEAMVVDNEEENYELRAGFTLGDVEAATCFDSLITEGDWIAANMQPLRNSPGLAERRLHGTCMDALSCAKHRYREDVLIQPICSDERLRKLAHTVNTAFLKLHDAPGESKLEKLDRIAREQTTELFKKRIPIAPFIPYEEMVLGRNKVPPMREKGGVKAKIKQDSFRIPPRKKRQHLTRAQMINARREQLKVEAEKKKIEARNDRLPRSWMDPPPREHAEHVVLDWTEQRVNNILGNVSAQVALDQLALRQMANIHELNH